MALARGYCGCVLLNQYNLVPRPKHPQTIMVVTLGYKSKLVLVVVAVLLLLLLLKYNMDEASGLEKEPVFRRTFNRIANTPGEFCLVTYNILSDQAIVNHTERYAPLSQQEKLKEPNPRTSLRHKQMMRELKWLDPDIIVLQEVDAFYFPILVKELGFRDFKGHFQQHFPKSNGLATFYNVKKFTLENSMTYGFNEILSKMNDLNKLKNSNNRNQRIAQFTMLTDLETGSSLVIANIHLMFGHWKEPDMHALQISLFLQHLHKFAVTEEGPVPWIISGDFNTYPHFPTYKLIANGKVSDEEFEKLNGFKYKYPQIVEKKKVEDEKSFVFKNCRQHLSHPLKDIKSAYKSVLGSEPPLTHYQIDQNFPELYGFKIMKGTLDYIWYSSDALQVNAVLEPVKEAVIVPLVACPNKYFPSDHLSLKACFGFKS